MGRAAMGCMEVQTCARSALTKPLKGHSYWDHLIHFWVRMKMLGDGPLPIAHSFLFCVMIFKFSAEYKAKPFIAIAGPTC